MITFKEFLGKIIDGEMLIKTIVNITKVSFKPFLMPQGALFHSENNSTDINGIVKDYSTRPALIAELSI